MFHPICVKTLHDQSVDTSSKSVNGQLLSSYVSPTKAEKPDTFQF